MHYAKVLPPTCDVNDGPMFQRPKAMALYRIACALEHTDLYTCNADIEYDVALELGRATPTRATAQTWWHEGVRCPRCQRRLLGSDYASMSARSTCRNCQQELDTAHEYDQRGTRI